MNTVMCPTPELRCLQLASNGECNNFLDDGYGEFYICPLEVLGQIYPSNRGLSELKPGDVAPVFAVKPHEQWDKHEEGCTCEDGLGIRADDIVYCIDCGAKFGRWRPT